MCKKPIRQSKGPGRPKTTHTRCKKTPKKKKAKKKKAKKKAPKKKVKKKAKKKKRGSVTRRGSSTTRSRQGREIMGARGWLSLWYYGPSKGGRGSDKTWAVKVEKKGTRYRVVTRWGRRTGQKNVTKHAWTTKEKALKKANSLLRSKVNKGYEGWGSNRKKKRRKRRHKSRR